MLKQEVKDVCVVRFKILTVLQDSFYWLLIKSHSVCTLKKKTWSPVQIFSYLQSQFLLHCVLAESGCSYNHSQPISRDFRAQSASVERYDSEVRFETWSYMFNMDTDG